VRVSHFHQQEVVLVQQFAHGGGAVAQEAGSLSSNGNRFSLSLGLEVTFAAQVDWMV
jgi:hypothetical protein